MKYNITNEQKKIFNDNINYIINHLKEYLSNKDKLHEQTYLEMSKEQIIDSFNKALMLAENWPKYFAQNDIASIQKEYKKLENILSELEWNLAEYDDIFHGDGMSYSIYKIGKLLVEILNS